jgi:hypothetical protein
LVRGKFKERRNAMFKWLGSPILWGVLFILGGILFLLENLGIFEGGGLFWAIVFALGGIFFLTMYRGVRSNWWALIPGMTLLGIALIIILGELFPAINEYLGGVIVTAAIGTAFLIVFLGNRSFWWALVPAGVMYSVSLMIIIDTLTTGFDAGGIILLGIAATFVVLALLPGVQVEMRWAWIPAVILGLIGILVLAESSNVIGYLWPAALILAGLFFIWRTVRARS